MKVYRCEEMSCGHCVSRIENGLNEAGIRHEINLENKTVRIDGDEKVDQLAQEVLDDLGYTPVAL